MARALVLGGGGVTGIAWQIGLAYGLSERDVDLRLAELIVGTSAGAVVAVQLCSDRDLAELYEAQLEGRSREIPTSMPWEGRLRNRLLSGWPGDHPRVRASLGRYALHAPPAAPAVERRAVIERRLPVREWPSARLHITAVDARSGELRVFDAASGVDLVDAVSASCALPGVWPPVRIEGRWYIDGGTRSATNADLAEGSDPLLVVAPKQPAAPIPARLRHWPRDTGRIAVLTPDAVSRRAAGSNTLNPTSAGAAARAGRAQGRRAAVDLAGLWNSS